MKFFLILILIFYVIYLVFGYFMRVLFSSVQQQQRHQQAHSQKQHRKAADSNLNIDYVPEGKDHNQDFKGGDYVDYEEIK